MKTMETLSDLRKEEERIVMLRDGFRKGRVSADGALDALLQSYAALLYLLAEREVANGK